MRRLLLPVLVLAVATPALAGFRVQNGRIYDDNNNPVQLRGVNWFGFDTTGHVLHGLWAGGRNWRSMILQMKSLGFNDA